MASLESKEKWPNSAFPIRQMIIVVSVLTIFCVGVGLILGYYMKISLFYSLNSLCFNAKWVEENSELSNIRTCSHAELSGNSEAIRFRQLCEADSCRAISCDLPLPRTYVVYQVAADVIRVDGLLDEAAWKEIAWTEEFVDVKGEEYPKPNLQTKVKLRWDNTYLYIGAILQDTDIWANKSLRDTTVSLCLFSVYEDNAFQVLLDTEQSYHKYKEIVINALGTVSDTMLTRPYLDDGEPLVLWDSNLIRAIYIDGQINNHDVPDKFWQVEMALPFKTLVAATKVSSNPPKDKDVWRANFVRSNWETYIAAGKYQKKLDTVADWWAWNSPGVTNIHLPDRWGLLQFRTSPVNASTFQTDEYWFAREALSEIYRAEKSYKANTGRYTDNLNRLKLLPYILSGQCMRKPQIKLNLAGFIASVNASRRDLKQINIRTDRYVWFGNNF